MESVIHRCGAEVPAGAYLCPECGSPVRDGAGSVIGPVDDGESTQARPAVELSSPAEESAGPEATRPCPTVWCGGVVRSDETFCPYCHSPVPAAPTRTGAVPDARAVVALRLRFPHGQVVVLRPGHAVELGREVPDSAVTQALLPLGAVSRRHARVEWIDEHITVTDLNSTNGTYVDGIAASPAVTKPRGPMVVRLGKTVIVHIESGE